MERVLILTHLDFNRGSSQHHQALRVLRGLEATCLDFDSIRFREEHLLGHGDLQWRRAFRPDHRRGQLYGGGNSWRAACKAVSERCRWWPPSWCSRLFGLCTTCMRTRSGGPKMTQKHVSQHLGSPPSHDLDSERSLWPWSLQHLHPPRSEKQKERQRQKEKEEKD